jgi:hypothetical protein
MRPPSGSHLNDDAKKNVDDHSNMFNDDHEIPEEASITSKDATKHTLFSQADSSQYLVKRELYDERSQGKGDRINEGSAGHDFFGIKINKQRLQGVPQLPPPQQLGANFNNKRSHPQVKSESVGIS